MCVHKIVDKMHKIVDLFYIVPSLQQFLLKVKKWEEMKIADSLGIWQLI